MLKKLAPILSILLIASNAFANQPAQEEIVASTSSKNLKKRNPEEYIINGAVMSTATVCLVSFAFLNHDKQHSVIRAAKNNKITLVAGALSGYTGLLALACFACAALHKHPSFNKQHDSVLAAPTSTQEPEAANKLAADTNKENDTKSASDFMLKNHVSDFVAYLNA